MEKVNTITLDGESLSVGQLYSFSMNALRADSKFKIVIADSAKKKIKLAEDFVKEICNGEKAVYGINTGFGKFAEVKVSKDKLAELQRNIIFSHCCGVGAPLSRQIVMAMWIARLNVMCRGNSGTRLSTIEKIISFLERGLLAEIPSRGSVGASGDLAPSSHATIVYLGEGECTIPVNGEIKKMHASKALELLGEKPIELAPKEGLSLINGTQLTSVLAINALQETKKLLSIANMSLAMTIEGTRGSHKSLNLKIHESKNQKGAIHCALETLGNLGGTSEISESHSNCHKVQDAYSIRCAPLVHGTAFDEIVECERVLNAELNSSTDNPLLFPETKESLSGGNFHALYPARVSDKLATCITQLMSISERRTASMMNSETTGLPTFLIEEGGLNSGFMMAQVTAAALVSEAKTLCFPASVDSIPTNDDKEDHVSMGPAAGFKANQIVDLAFPVFAIELLASAQAIDLLAPLKTTENLKKIHTSIRKHSDYLDHDRFLSKDINNVSQALRDNIIKA